MIVHRIANRLSTDRTVRGLQRANRTLTSPVVGDSGAVVSLTTHGTRLATVHLTIESIALGVQRPKRLILWLDDPATHRNLTPSLRRLQARGLEIKLTENFGPHTKYYPYLLEDPADPTPLVTADDDILYPPSWLSDLLDAHAISPKVPVCHRAHEVGLSDRQLLPYLSWRPCDTDSPSFSTFVTGVSGVLYPAEAMVALRQAGREFLEVCRLADDVWINATLTRAGIPARQIRRHPASFPIVRSAQSIGLWRANVDGGKNDEYLSRCYDPAVIRSIATQR